MTCAAHKRGYPFSRMLCTAKLARKQMLLMSFTTTSAFFTEMSTSNLVEVHRRHPRHTPVFPLWCITRAAAGKLGKETMIRHFMGPNALCGFTQLDWFADWNWSCPKGGCTITPKRIPRNHIPLALMYGAFVKRSCLSIRKCHCFDQCRIRLKL